MTRRRPAVLLVAGVLLLGACSSDGAGDDAGDDEASTTTTPVPSGDGDRCDDPTGDLDVPPGVADEARAALAGVDLTSASAVVDGDDLVVGFEVAGPIAEVIDPTFVVAQGDPLQPFSFEVRLTRTGDDWSSLVVTWPSGREQRQDANLVVLDEGSSLRTSLPLSALPPIASSMQFGVASEVSAGVVVIDDCSSLLG